MSELSRSALLARAATAAATELLVVRLAEGDPEVVWANDLAGDVIGPLSHLIALPDGSPVDAARLELSTHERVAVRRRVDGRAAVIRGAPAEREDAWVLELLAPEPDRQLVAVGALVDASPALIYAKDRTGRYLFCNRAFTEYHRRPREDILGKDDREFFPADLAASYRDNDQQILLTGVGSEFEELRSDEGSTGVVGGVRQRVSMSHKFPLRDASGKIFAVGGITLDSSEQAWAVEDARRARQLADAVGTATSDLLSQISEELRAPLKAVRGLSGLLGADDLPDDAARYVTSIERACATLVDLVDQVMEISRTETGIGREGVETTPSAAVSLHELSVTAVAGCRSRAERSGVDVVCDVGCDDAVLADRDRLERALGALLDNAVAFNRPGGRVELFSFAHGTRRCLVLADTGRGLARADISRLFEPFERALDQRAPSPGFGLGLPLARSLVMSMGGSLRLVDSVVGKGSTFMLELEAAEAPPATARTGPVRSRDAPRRHDVLLLSVDDRFAGDQLVRTVFESAVNAALRVAPDVSSAMRMARHRRPDVVIFDVTSTDSTTEGTLASMVDDPALAGVPFLILAADVRMPLVERTGGSRMVHAIGKPFALLELLSGLRAVLSTSA